MNVQEQLSLMIWLQLKMLKQLEELTVGQADINTDVQAIGNAVSALAAATAVIKAEITSLEGQGVDTSGLDSAVAQLGQAVEGVQALAPASTTSSTGTASSAPVTSSTGTPQFHKA